MLTVFPLLSVLSAVPAIANSYSTSEKRTLQSAVSSALHSTAVSQYYLQCKELPVEGEPAVSVTDKQYHRLQALLQEKVHSSDVEKLLQADARLTHDVKRSITPPKDCSDSKAYLSLLDNYELALFSLEIAMPLSKPIANASAAKNRQASAQRSELKQLIARSNSIALVSVSDKQLLSPVQQANFLHPDYQGRYIFKVEQGWNNSLPNYMGMHVFIAEAELSKTAKQWLVFLDKNNHFIKAIALDSAGAYLTALQEPHWRFDVHGNLHRNK